MLRIEFRKSLVMFVAFLNPFRLGRDVVDHNIADSAAVWVEFVGILIGTDGVYATAGIKDFSTLFVGFGF